jgi:hypothetical protein
MIEFKSANTFPTFPSSNRLNVAYPVIIIAKLELVLTDSYFGVDKLFQPLPFASLINGPLSVGNEIQVHGQVKPHPNR